MDSEMEPGLESVAFVIVPETERKDIKKLQVKSLHFFEGFGVIHAIHVKNMVYSKKIEMNKVIIFLGNVAYEQSQK